MSRIRIRLILMGFLETSDRTEESRKDEIYLQFEMKKHYIKTRKISQIKHIYICVFIGRVQSSTEAGTLFIGHLRGFYIIRNLKRRKLFCLHSSY